MLVAQGKPPRLLTISARPHRHCAGFVLLMMGFSVRVTGWQHVAAARRAGAVRLCYDLNIFVPSLYICNGPISASRHMRCVAVWRCDVAMLAVLSRLVQTSSRGVVPAT